MLTGGFIRQSLSIPLVNKWRMAWWNEDWNIGVYRLQMRISTAVVTVQMGIENCSQRTLLQGLSNQ
jgi:hypothetical protein